MDSFRAPPVERGAAQNAATPSLRRRRDGRYVARRIERVQQHSQTRMPPPSLTAVWELNLQRPGFRSTEDLISPHGQELAPWHMDQVAVASKGLSPQPLWISAGGKPAN